MSVALIHESEHCVVREGGSGRERRTLNSVIEDLDFPSSVTLSQFF
jgi:hypothetical protein